MRIFSSKRVALATAVVATGIAGAAVVIAAATFGPSRPTYTWANPASSITFNSITDNPVWGDERQLLKVRDASTSSSNNATQAQVTDNEEVLMTVYFHNNAASNLNLVAHNTKVKITLPTSSATTLTPTAYITADNANPSQVWATADLTSSQPFTVSYIPGSAKLFTNYVSGVQVSDSVVTDGALVGTNGANGNVTGCAQFSGYVTIRVKVKVTPPTPQPKFACTALDVAQIDRTRFDFTAHATTENATVSSYAFVAKDANGNVVDTNTVNTNALSAVYHFNQSNPGTYTVSVSVTTDKGTASSSECVKQITVAAPPQVLPAVTPTKAVELPKTGPGDVLGIFAGASALGTAGHYAVRRFRR